MPTTYETDPDRLYRMRAELAPHWHDDAPGGPGPGTSPFVPDAKKPCSVCRLWVEELAHYQALEKAAEDAAGDPSLAEQASAELTMEAIDRMLALEERLREHRAVLHKPLESLPEAWEGLMGYAHAVPDRSDGRPIWREPVSGITERSKAFYLLNRHHLGRIVAAQMGDHRARVEGASEHCLRLFDAYGRGLFLTGCTSGYGGEGPHGTLWVLRLSGFPEGATVTGGFAMVETDLERTVFGRATFNLAR